MFLLNNLVILVEDLLALEKEWMLETSLMFGDLDTRKFKIITTKIKENNKPGTMSLTSSNKNMDQIPLSLIKSKTQWKDKRSGK
jgi:hypothetical protein